MISKSLYTFVFTGAALFAAAPPIGIVTASGPVLVERSQVWGNSTLFDGATVETRTASSDLALRNGTRLQLAAGSRAQVWQDHVALQQGIGQVGGTASYELSAAGLKIHASDKSARVRVALGDRVEVAALSGAARVTSQSGLLLASIPAGRSMSFSMQAGATGAVTRTGCLLYKDGHFILQDDNTQEVAELNGQNLAANVGNRVEAVGTASATKPAVSIATSLLNVTRVTVKSQGGCLSTAAALNAQTEAPTTSTAPANTASTTPKVSEPTASGGGMSKGAKVAIVVLAAGGGAGAAIALAGHKSSTSP